MGYCIQVTSVNFRLSASNKEAAFKAIKSLRGQETCRDSCPHFSWVSAKDFDEASNLEEMLEEWRWKPSFNESGDVVYLTFTGEKYGDDNLLFKVIAPFVESGSFIKFLGEDGSTWKYVFDGSSMKEVQGRNVRYFEDEEE